MEKINVMDFEKEIVKNLRTDNEFMEYLDKNAKKELVLDYSNLKLKELEDEDLDILGEESVLDYLEEVASIVLDEDKNKSRDKLVEENLPVVASIAFNYLREGIAYLDVVQEGTMGLIKAIESYKDKSDIEFDNYKKYWIIREIVLFINNKIADIKNEFKSYFRLKKENFGKEEEHEHSQEEEHDEVYLKESDLLPNVEAIEKREKLADRILEFSVLKNRLSQRQIEVLNYYFGFGVDRRYSIFEIEEKLELPKGQGEEIFEQALVILSTMEGKMFL